MYTILSPAYEIHSTYEIILHPKYYDYEKAERVRSTKCNF